VQDGVCADEWLGITVTRCRRSKTLLLLIYMSHHCCVCQTCFQMELQFALGCLAGQRKVCKTCFCSVIQDIHVVDISFSMCLLANIEQRQLLCVCLLLIVYNLKFSSLLFLLISQKTIKIYIDRCLPNRFLGGKQKSVNNGF